MADGLSWPLFLLLVFGSTAAVLFAAARAEGDEDDH
jgi:hypothetical protein